MLLAPFFDLTTSYRMDFEELCRKSRLQGTDQCYAYALSKQVLVSCSSLTNTLQKCLSLVDTGEVDSVGKVWGSRFALSFPAAVVLNFAIPTHATFTNCNGIQC